MQNRTTSITIIFLFIAFNIFCSNNKDIPSKKSFRGVVLYPSDILSIGAEKTIAILKEADINLIGIHSNSITENLDSLRLFLESNEGKLFMNLCKVNNIDIEYECHVLQEILTRTLFKDHPEYFRVDTNGIRTTDWNMCFSSDEAWDIIERNMTELLKWIKPTTNRYFFWTDDSYDGFCHCEKCKIYSPSDQALIYENRMLKIIRKINPKATLAHLAYASTLNAPKIITPEKGIFLEFAPIGRNYVNPLPSEQYEALKENLTVFSKETACILEYWLDASMFSNWKRNEWRKIPWNAGYCKRDVEIYRKLGIDSFTTFATWMLHQNYFDLYGENETIAVLDEYGAILKARK
ncbi:DUF4838 domain-containing protein [Limibacterium fermenti]|jgi:hypothetical protein|uniref:DUF4838 domain-containing protein n=1 Tax=Limibacterium fermenti TaxID=3229863 RepID=UPI0026D693D8